MSRLRIISNGALAWLDEGPANGATGPARVSGEILIAPADRRAKAQTVRPLHGRVSCELVQRCRHAPCIAARAAEARRLFETTDMTLAAIGEALGGRDHSTVSYWLREFEQGAA